MEFNFTVSAEDAGQRLDKFLAARLGELSRSRVQALIKEGLVTVNGRSAKSSHDLETGDMVAGSVPPDKPADARPQDLPLEVLYEDEHLAVLNKASGMVVHPAHGNEDGTLVNALLHRFGAMSSIGGVARPGIVHRLDKETSGCLVVARNDATHQSLTEQFAGRSVEKVYLAVVQGVPANRSGTVETHIGRDPHDRLRMAVLPPPAGKSAVTDYEVLHVTGLDALVRCTLHTGRTHQIRVHMKHLGHPLLGDEIYARLSRQTRTGRLMLHALRLGFSHPATGQRMVFHAPVPPEFGPWLPPGFQTGTG
jgi:23S rRNA pseudouridine1911/1915/1917 synthase